MSTAGVQGRTWVSLNSRLTVSEKTRRPVGRSSMSKGLCLITGIFRKPPELLNSSSIIKHASCTVKLFYVPVVMTRPSPARRKQEKTAPGQRPNRVNAPLHGNAYKTGQVLNCG